MKNLKGLTLILFVVLALFAALYLSKQTTFFSPKATTSFQQYELDSEVPVVETASDLDQQIQSLEDIDLDQIDEAIRENELDSSNL